MDPYDPLTQSTEDFCFQPDPICAPTLADKEANLRVHLASFPPVKYGCPELDDGVLLGGLQRGCVVGISADDADNFGLLMGLQGMIRAILDGSVNRALVITPKPLASISKLIVDITNSELSKSGLSQAEIHEKCRAGLESVMLSVVFDINGIWQTLSELLEPLAAAASPSISVGEASTRGLDSKRSASTAEIQDRKDGNLPRLVGHNRVDSQEESGPSSHTERSSAMCPPEIIVVTHFSTLLASLFASREKKEAHKSLAFLKARLRALSHSPSTSPLLLLVNSTTEEPSIRHKESASDFSSPTSSHRSPESTLRSVFALVRGLQPSRPSFGVVFSQLLDLHLLCTNLLKHQAASSCCLEKAAVSVKTDSRYHSPKLVEVLQDNLGLDSAHIHKHHREQRWAVLDVHSHQVVNACEHWRASTG